MPDDMVAIDVQTIGARRKSSLDALAKPKPKVLQPPTGNHGRPDKCAVCKGAALAQHTMLPQAPLLLSLAW